MKCPYCKKEIKSQYNCPHCNLLLSKKDIKEIGKFLQKKILEHDMKKINNLEFNVYQKDGEYLN